MHVRYDYVYIVLSVCCFGRAVLRLSSLILFLIDILPSSRNVENYTPKKKYKFTGFFPGAAAATTVVYWTLPYNKHLWVEWNNNGYYFIRIFLYSINFPFRSSWRSMC